MVGIGTCVWGRSKEMILFLFSWEASLLLRVCRDLQTRSSWSTEDQQTPMRHRRDKGRGSEAGDAQLGSGHVFFNQAACISALTTACRAQRRLGTLFLCSCSGVFGATFLCSSEQQLYLTEEDARAGFVFQPFTRFAICFQQKLSIN